MSKKEFDRLEVLLGVRSGRLHVADACALLSLKRRQVFRLLAGLKHGDAMFLTRLTGTPRTNDQVAPAFQPNGASAVGARAGLSLKRQRRYSASDRPISNRPGIAPRSLA
jgi:hypothetical protein